MGWGRGVRIELEILSRVFHRVNQKRSNWLGGGPLREGKGGSLTRRGWGSLTRRGGVIGIDIEILRQVPIALVLGLQPASLVERRNPLAVPAQ